MELRQFELELLNAPGNAKDKIRKFFGKDISKSNAEKRWTGILMYLNYIQELPSEHRQMGEMEKIITLANGTVTTNRMLWLSEEDSKDKKKVMKLMGFDPLQWELVKCEMERKYWDVSMRVRQGQDENGRYLPDVPTQKTNHAFSVKISVKPIQDIVTTDTIKEIFNEINFDAPEVPLMPNYGNCLIEPSILDFHLGKGLSLEEEIKLYKRTLLTMLGKIEMYNLKPEKFLFQIGQDFIHFDNSNKTTTAGTPMETSPIPWSDIYDAAFELLVWTTEQFLQICPVDYVYVPGNHDKTLSYCLSHSIAKVYEKNKNVSVDLVDYPRKYYQYNWVGIAMAHGEQEGKKIEDTFQQEATEIWASTFYREYHLGHLHSERSYEKGGIVYRRTSSITELDTWHVGKAYRAIRKAPMYVWHKNGDKDILDVLVKI